MYCSASLLKYFTERWIIRIHNENFSQRIFYSSPIKSHWDCLKNNEARKVKWFCICIVNLTAHRVVWEVTLSIHNWKSINNFLVMDSGEQLSLPNWIKHLLSWLILFPLDRVNRRKTVKILLPSFFLPPPGVCLLAFTEHVGQSCHD